MLLGSDPTPTICNQATGDRTPACASVLSLGRRLGAALEMARSLGAGLFAKSRRFRRDPDPGTSVAPSVEVLLVAELRPASSLVTFQVVGCGAQLARCIDLQRLRAESRLREPALSQLS
jgi:hypothetical protein